MITRGRLALAVGSLALLLIGCGASGTEDDTSSTPPASTSSTAGNPTDSGPPVSNGAGIPLHESIADLPLPDGYEIPFHGGVNPASADPRETMSQIVLLPQFSHEVAEFLLRELPTAGFTIVEGNGLLTDPASIEPNSGYMIHIVTPAGVPGHLFVQPLTMEGGTRIGINLHLAEKQ